MKNRTVKAMIGVLATVLLVGCNSIMAGEPQTDIADNITVSDSYIDMDTENMQDGATQVYYIQTDDDMDRLKVILENRNGKIIIEVSNGTVTDSNGDGIDVCGY